jgi:hypothetical protein
MLLPGSKQTLLAWMDYYPGTRVTIHPRKPGLFVLGYPGYPGNNLRGGIPTGQLMVVSDAAVFPPVYTGTRITIIDTAFA